MGNRKASSHSFSLSQSSIKPQTLPTYGLRQKRRPSRSSEPKNVEIPSPIVEDLVKPSDAYRHKPESYFPDMSEQPPPSNVLANLYIYLLVDAKPITILSDPDGIPDIHVSLLRACLQTFSDEREYIVGLGDVACDICVKHLREKSWIKRTFRKHPIHIMLKRLNFSTWKGITQPQLECTHEYRLMKFSDKVLPSNCARIHNLIIKTGDAQRIDPCELRSAVLNIVSYLPNLRNITFHYRHEHRRVRRKYKITASPGPLRRPVGHLHEDTQLGTMPLRVSRESERQARKKNRRGSVITLLDPNYHTTVEELPQIPPSPPKKTRVAELFGIEKWEANDAVTVRDKREYLDCLKILEHHLPRGGRLQFKGREWYPGMTKEWCKQRRKWYE